MDYNNIHIYKKGECLKCIANKYNITIERLIELNHLTNIDYLNDGDILIIGE